MPRLKRGRRHPSTTTMTTRVPSVPNTNAHLLAHSLHQLQLPLWITHLHQSIQRQRRLCLGLRRRSRRRRRIAHAHIRDRRRRARRRVWALRGRSLGIRGIRTSCSRIGFGEMRRRSKVMKFGKEWGFWSFDLGPWVDWVMMFLDRVGFSLLFCPRFLVCIAWVLFVYSYGPCSSSFLSCEMGVKGRDG